MMPSNNPASERRYSVQEAAEAVRAGAKLVLSVNHTNRAAAKDWGCEVVVVPDQPSTLAGLDDTVNYLSKGGVRFRIDPVIEPIGFGFAQSLGRYLEVRRRYPDAAMLMGVGNPWSIPFYVCVALAVRVATLQKSRERAARQARAAPLVPAIAPAQ